MEILFEILIMNLQKFDIDAIKKDVSTCKQLVIDGADWDKKNKFKIFEGVYCMLIRDFNKAAELFLSSVATFTCVELMDYKEFVFYTVVTSCVTQSRKTIKKEVILEKVEQKTNFRNSRFRFFEENDEKQPPEVKELNKAIFRSLEGRNGKNRNDSISRYIAKRKKKAENTEEEQDKRLNIKETIYPTSGVTYSQNGHIVKKE